jgi:hypothetical protein
MSYMEITYWASEKLLKAQAITTGHINTVQQTIRLDLAAATPEQRAIVVAHNGANSRLLIRSYALKVETWPWVEPDDPSREMVRAKIEENYAYLDVAPDTWAAVVEQVERMAAERKQAEASIPAALEQARQECAEYKAKKAREEAERLAAAERDRVETEERRRVAKEREEARLAERLTWAREHGSEHLQRALDAGHDCARLFWTERAGVEYPDFVLDGDSHAEWKDCFCPSVKALDSRDAVLAAHPGAKATIVWLTAEPRNSASDDEDDDEYECLEPFRECEALIVDDPAFDKWLVRAL